MHFHADLVRHNVANLHAGNARVYELTKFAERYNAENLRNEFALKRVRPELVRFEFLANSCHSKHNARHGNY